MSPNGVGNGVFKLTALKRRLSIIEIALMNSRHLILDLGGGGGGIEIVYSCKYLGLWLQEYLDLNFTSTEIAKSASRALGVIISKYKVVGGVNYRVFYTVYENLVQPILSYGAAIWGTKEFSWIIVIQNRRVAFTFIKCS